jgi:hypothetical protein
MDFQIYSDIYRTLKKFLCSPEGYSIYELCEDAKYSSSVREEWMSVGVVRGKTIEKEGNVPKKKEGEKIKGILKLKL